MIGAANTTPDLRVAVHSLFPSVHRKLLKRVKSRLDPFIDPLYKGRKVMEDDGICHLREANRPYVPNFESQKYDIDSENAYFWNTNIEISST